MKMKTICFSAAIAVLFAAQPALSRDKDRDRDDAAAAAIVGGLLLGAAAIAASSHDHKHKHHKHVRERPRPRPASPFSPAANVTCYPAEQACYRRNGRLARKWTLRIYG